MLNHKKTVKMITSSAQLASILEVSGWPKPGNVHRIRDHADTRYEHFLIGSIALGSSVEAASLKGIKVVNGKLNITEIGIGNLIKKGTSDIIQSHYGGNTHLGITLLFIPLASAAGISYANKDNTTPDILQKNVNEIIKSTTSLDAIAVYETIKKVSTPRQLGKFTDKRIPDLYDKDAKKKILENGITLFDIMEESSSYDTIAREFITAFDITFNTGYLELIKTFKKTKDINIATVHTFLTILSKNPDTLIARKIGQKNENDIKKAVELGIQKTKWISETSEQILKKGGLTTEEGRTMIWDFDNKLQMLGNDYNPGTTADLTASTLMVALLCGLKI